MAPIKKNIFIHNVSVILSYFYKEHKIIK